MNERTSQEKSFCDSNCYEQVYCCALDRALELVIKSSSITEAAEKIKAEIIKPGEKP